MVGSWIRRILLVLLLGGIVVGAVWWLGQVEPIEVEVFAVERGRVEQTVTNSRSGSVRTRHRAMLSPEIGGRVIELAVREGDRVERDQVLLRLADADLRARLVLAERTVEVAEAAVDESCRAAQQAELELTRQRRLFEQRVASADVLDRASSAASVAEAGCRAAVARSSEAEASVALARVELRKSALRAPFDGIVAEVATEIGEWLTPSPPGVQLPAVIELLDPAAIYVQAPLDEVDLGQVRVGQPARVTFDAFPDEHLPGTVARVAPYVSSDREQSRTFDVEIELDDHERALRLLPGTSADVEVVLAVREDVVRMPSYALIEGNRALVLSDGRLVARAVTTGLSNWRFVEIVTGLRVDERVVVSLDRMEVAEGVAAVASGELPP